jgi:hypothetical protein
MATVYAFLRVPPPLRGALATAGPPSVKQNGHRVEDVVENYREDGFGLLEKSGALDIRVL